MLFVCCDSFHRHSIGFYSLSQIQFKMIKVIVVVLFIIGTVAAQNDLKSLTEALIKRGETLVEDANREIEELYDSGHGHLASALEHQIALAEALVVSLKIEVHELKKTHAFHHLHAIEEELLHRENRIMEELHIIYEMKHHNHDHSHHTVEQLIERGEALIKKAKAALEHMKHTRDAHALETEMFWIEDLIDQLKKGPNDENLKKHAEQLARHEKTIEQLLDRVSY